MTEKKTAEAVDSEALQQRILEAVNNMTPSNWILLRKRLELSKEEILSDDSTLMVMVLWIETGTTSQNLVELMDTPTKELQKRLGIDVDKLMAEAQENADA